MATYDKVKYKLRITKSLNPYIILLIALFLLVTFHVIRVLRDTTNVLFRKLLLRITDILDFGLFCSKKIQITFSRVLSRYIDTH